MKHFAVIGSPIKHSLSPIMHRWIFERLGIDAEYQKINVDNNHLPKIIQKIRNGALDGINITIPLKEAVLTFLDEINPRAKSIGAVNCIMISNSKIIGNNTDWYGFSMALKKNNINTLNREVIILGAGGSARSILYALKRIGVQKMFLLNRTIEKAMKLQDSSIFVHPLQDANKIIKTNSIIINTTSVGMQNNKSPINFGLINKNQILFDIIYSPLETSLLECGKKRGALTVNGLDMFIHQGLASLDLWFGSSISTQVNFLKLKNYLESELC